jgi:MraZ protein
MTKVGLSFRRHYKPCLNIYPERFWNERLEAIEKKLNPFDDEDADLMSRIYASYATVTMAPNGRISFPSTFMTHAGIEREVIFAGNGVSISVWDEKAYFKDAKEGEKLREKYKERLGNLKKEA